MEQQDAKEIAAAKALWHSVLKLGIRDAMGDVRDISEGSERRQARADALAWMADDSQEIGGFQWCCSLFGLDSSAVRRAVSEKKIEKNLSELKAVDRAWPQIES